jgi:hypothetical protein
VIRVEFTSIERGPWSFEMAMNHAITKTLRQHGVPIAARLAFAGVERGELRMTHEAEDKKVTFVYIDVDESQADQQTPFKRTHNGKGYSVYMNSHHLAKHEEDEEL